MRHKWRRDALARPARSRDRVPAEARLLLLTAGGAENDAAIRELAHSGLDWPRFVGLAQRERAVPVVYTRLRNVVADAIPADVSDQMRRLALVSDFAMLHLESRLHESLRALDSAQVRVMLLKGAALAHTAYAGFCQRPMSDLDVLVDAGNAQLARQLMLEKGWREVEGDMSVHRYDRHHHLPPLRDAQLPELQLEIHTALFPERQPFAFDTRDVWAGAQALGPMFPNTYVPNAMHSLLHACLHFLWSHEGRFGVWRTIRDVDALARTGNVDWSAFVAAARATRGGTSCYWTFRIAQRTAGVSVPGFVLDELRPPRSGSVLDALERHFAQSLFSAAFACPSVSLDHALWELAVMPGWSGHGKIRPWDEYPAFMGPGGPSKSRSALRRERIRRFLASLGYIRMLLRTGD